MSTQSGRRTEERKLKGSREGDTVILRNVREGDLGVFFEHQREAPAIQMTALPPRDRDAFMTHWREKILGSDTVIKRTILFQNQVAGNILCYVQDESHLIGYWLGKDYWGKGIATKALSEFLILIKNRPLQAYVATHNTGSIRVLENCGFKCIGKNNAPLGKGGADIEEFLYQLNESQEQIHDGGS